MSEQVRQQNDQQHADSGLHSWLGIVAVFTLGCFMACDIDVNIAYAQETTPPVTSSLEIETPTQEPVAGSHSEVGSHSDDEEPQAEAIANGADGEEASLVEAETSASPAPDSQADLAEVESESQTDTENEEATPDTNAVASEAETHSSSDVVAEVNDDFVDPTALAEPAASEEPARESSPFSDKPKELSVRPGSTPLMPADRPAWVGAPADLSKEIHRLYVGGTAVSNSDDADRALDAALVTALEDYVGKELLRQGYGAHDLGLSAGYVRKNLVVPNQDYLMELDTHPPMYRKYVPLEISPEDREFLLQQNAEAVQRSRIAPLGLGLAAILGLVGVSHLVLKRKNSLPSSQPLEGPQIVPNQVAAVGRGGRNKSSLIASLMTFFVLAFLFAGLAMAVLLPLFYVGAARQEIHQTQLRTVTVPNPPNAATKVITELPSMPALPPMPTDATYSEEVAKVRQATVEYRSSPNKTDCDNS